MSSDHPAKEAAPDAAAVPAVEAVSTPETAPVADAAPQAEAATAAEIAPPVEAAPEAPPAAPEPPPLRPALDDLALDTLFRTARTHNAWTDQPVTDDELRALYDLLKLAPTSANASPARFLFLRTPDSKQKLRPALSAGNLEKTMKAPVTVIVAHDPKFYDYLPRLFPHADARAWFANNRDLADETAFRNGTLQGAYLILAARALGLDAGPMSGFDRARVDEAFLDDRGWKCNFLINLGHGDPAGTYERGPRLYFDEVAILL